MELELEQEDQGEVLIRNRISTSMFRGLMDFIRISACPLPLLLPHFISLSSDLSSFTFQNAPFSSSHNPLGNVLSHLLTHNSLSLPPQTFRSTLFLPTDNGDYKDVDIPSVDGMRVLSISKQDFGKWARRLVTMEKVGEGVGYQEVGERGIVWEGEGEGKGLEEGIAGLGLKNDGDEDENKDGEEVKEKGRIPGHADFRRKYFAKFSSEQAQ